MSANSGNTRRSMCSSCGSSRMAVVVVEIAAVTEPHCPTTLAHIEWVPSFLLQHLARTLTGLGLPLLTRLDNDRMMWRVFRINVGIKWSIKLKLVYILNSKCCRCIFGDGNDHIFSDSLMV